MPRVPMTPERRKLIDTVKRDWRAGALSRPKIAEKHGVTRMFVEYHTHGLARAAGPARRNPMVRVECAECGDPNEITRDALTKREREGRGPYRCRWCVNGWNRSREASTDWMRPEELEAPHDWAARVAVSMTRAERLMYVMVVDRSRLLDVDESRPAHGPTPRREQYRFEPHPYAAVVSLQITL